VAAYGTIVAPAAADRLTVHGAGEMLVVRPEADLAVLRADALRSGAAEHDAEAFFEQYA
jgi:hypothetical protein